MDEKKNVKDLTESEGVTYCREIGQYVRTAVTADEHKKWNCNYEGLRSASGSETTAEARRECIEERDECLAETPPDAGAPDAGGGAEDPCTKWKTRHDVCSGNLTIGDLNTCVRASTKRDKDFAARDVCANVGPDASAEFELAGGDPPECLVLQEKCPELYKK